MPRSSAPVEGKVWAATVGAGGGYVASRALLWLLGVTVWGVPFDASHAIQAVEAVPGPVANLLTGALGVGVAFAGGWQAKHSPRTASTKSEAPKLEAADDTPTALEQMDSIYPNG